jgi:hypothetical protein
LAHDGGDEFGVEIFLDLHDLSVLEAEDHAVVVVVAAAVLERVVAARLDDDEVAVGENARGVGLDRSFEPMARKLTSSASAST